MDELELLKKDWKKQDDVLPKLSYQEIYQMILKKSSSIIRWIFIISILEFLLWASIDIAARVSGEYERFETIETVGFSITFTVLYYSILLYFIIRFYLNYKRIQTTDSTKVLMQNILKTRRTVRHYVWINLSFISIAIISLVVYSVLYTDAHISQSTGEQVSVTLAMVVTIFVLGIFIGLFALFYRIIYGILTRRLKRNYKELEKLEL